MIENIQVMSKKEHLYKHGLRTLGVDDILKLGSGSYSGKDVNGREVIVFRKIGYGFTMKTDEGENCLWCVEYDESGRPVGSYPESSMEV